MIIEKLHLHHFGKFKDLDLDFGPALYVFFGKNEDGKSTIADAIQLAFYGSDSRSADPRQNLRHRYFDLTEEKARVLILFSEKEEVFRLDRTFGPTNGRDSIVLLNDRTGEEIPLKRNQPPGDLFFGMNADSFRRSFFVGAEGTVIGSSGKKDQLIDRLVNLETTGDERVSYVSVANHLENSSKKLLNPRGKGGLIFDSENKIRDLRSQYEVALADEDLKKEADQEILQLNRKSQELQKKLNEVQERKENLRAQLHQASLYEAQNIRLRLKTAEKNCQALSGLLNDPEGALDSNKLFALKENLSEWKRIEAGRDRRALEGEKHLTFDQEETELHQRGEMLHGQKAIYYEKLQNLDKELGLLKSQEETLKEQMNQAQEKKKKVEDHLFQPAPALSSDDLKRMVENQPKQEGLWARIRDVVFLRLFRWSFIILIFLGVQIFHFKPPIRYYYLLAFILLAAGIIYVSYRLKKYQEGQKQKKKLLELENQAFQERISAIEKDQKIRKDLQSRLNEASSDLNSLEKTKQTLQGKKEELEKRKKEILEKEEVLKDQFYQYQTDLMDLKRKKESQERATAQRKSEEIADRNRQEELAQGFNELMKNWYQKSGLKKEQDITLDSKEKKDGNPISQWEDLLGEIELSLQKLHDQELVRDHLFQSLPEEYKEMTDKEFQKELDEAGLKEKDIKAPDELAYAMEERDRESHSLLEAIASIRLEIAEKKSLILEKFAGKRMAETIALQIREEEQNYQVLLEKKEALDLAQEVLQEAYRETENSFSPLLNDRAGQILSKLTGGNYDQVKVNREFDLSVEETQTRQVLPWKLLSTGTSEQAYFALRLALIDLIDPEKNLPVFLDDPFVYYDDFRAERAFHFLEDYFTETGRQIFFFTAHQRFEKWIRKSEKIQKVFLV